jgi:hypothetical protein
MLYIITVLIGLYYLIKKSYCTYNLFEYYYRGDYLVEQLNDYEFNNLLDYDYDNDNNYIDEYYFNNYISDKGNKYNYAHKNYNFLSKIDKYFTKYFSIN